MPLQHFWVLFIIGCINVALYANLALKDKEKGDDRYVDICVVAFGNIA